MKQHAPENEDVVEKPPPGDWEALVEPLLKALHWKGTRRHVYEALGYHPEHLNLERFRNVMIHLGYSTNIRRDLPQRLGRDLLPAIYLGEDAAPRLLCQLDDVNGLPRAPATLLLFTPVASPVQPPGDIGLGKQLARFRPFLSQAALFSLVIGVMALAPALFNMAVYDQIIASGSATGLSMLWVGAVTALALELTMRHLRARRLSWFGARVDHYVSCSVFERLMYLPAHLSERVSVSSQLARLRDFETVREFLTGPLASLFFELPLIVVYLVAMAIISGWLAIIPVTMFAVFALMIWVFDAKLNALVQAASTAATKRHEYLLETVTRLRAIRLAGIEDTWLERGRQLSATAAHANFRATFGAQMLETASFVLMTLGVLATIVMGVHGVITDALTTGGLIAGLMLMWRIVAPVQMACASINRLQQLAASTRQVQHLLSVPTEHSPYATPALIRDIKGAVAFHRVWLRYMPDAEPALHGVSFEAAPGQVVAIRGSNGAGKSTILKLLLGMYPPQAGSVRLDGVDIRQIDPMSLRQEIAYTPQTADFFPGSVRDNLLLSYPAATDQDCLKALSDARALEEVNALPSGIDTVIGGADAEPVSYLLRQRLNLARAYVKPARVFLFDEGSYSLGQDSDLAFETKIASLRGHATVLIVTHREDHMRLADRLLALEKGEATHFGPPDQVLSVLARKR